MVRPDPPRLTPAALAALGLILLTAAGVRVAWLQHLRQAPDFTAPVLDPQLNDYWARALVTGDWTPPPGANDPLIRTTPYGRPPGYPWFLAGVYRLFGLHPLAPRLTQMTLGLLTILLVWWIGWRHFGPWGAGSAALLLAVTWPLPFFEGELNSPALEGACLALMIAGVAGVPGRRHPYAAAAGAGLAAGWLVITRPNALIPVILAAAWMAWPRPDQPESPRSSRTGWRKRLLPLAAFGTAVLVCGVPVLLRNRIIGGEWTPISYYGGVNLYIGNHPDSTGDAPRIPDILQITGWEGWNCFDYPYLIRGLADRQGLDGSFGAASRWFTARALENWKRYPGKMLRLTWRKTRLFWGPAIISDSKEVALERRQHPLMAILPGFPLAAGAGLAAALLSLLSRWVHRTPKTPAAAQLDGLLILLVLGHFLSVLPFFMAERYRVPAMIPLSLLAGGAVQRMRTAIQTRDLRWTVWPVVLLPAGVILTHLPLAEYQPDEARWHFHRGIALFRIGRPVSAAAELQCATARNPAYTWAWLYLAAAWEEMGWLEDALAACRRAVDLSGWPNAWNHLGWILWRLNRTAEAEQAFLEALRKDPSYRRARENLIRLRLETGDYTGAEAAARQALEQAPDNPDTWNTFGWTLHLQNRYREAEAAYRRALDLNPGHAAAQANLEHLRRTPAEDAPVQTSMPAGG